MKKVKVVHIINSFEHGGAEQMLCSLLLRSQSKQFDVSVVSLMDDLSVAGPLLRAGIHIEVIGLRKSLPQPARLLKLVKHLRAIQPDVIQTWMDHSNLIGGIAALAVPKARVAWGVHHSNHVVGVAKRGTLLVVRAGGLLSRVLTNGIVYCSEESQRRYSDSGFRSRRAVVIPNGFDISRFKPDADARRAIRDEIGLPHHARLVGLPARFDPLKDHDTFLRAAAHAVQTSGVDAHFLLCGAGVEPTNMPLMTQIRDLGISDRCHLLGPRSDMPRICASLDVMALSSISEAFPLVLGEAMACGVPCAATDVGDARLIVGQTGRIVPLRTPAALGEAFADLLSMPEDRRRSLSEAARQRVCDMFDLDAVIQRYESFHLGLVAAKEVAESPKQSFAPALFAGRTGELS